MRNNSYKINVTNFITICICMCPCASSKSESCGCCSKSALVDSFISLVACIECAERLPNAAVELPPAPAPNDIWLI